MKRFILVVLGLLLAGLMSAQAQPPRQVWALYMGFWAGAGSWDAQADVLTDRPALGSYDSRDPGIAAQHIDQAKSAGIDAFVVTWYGLEDGQTTTPALNNLLDRAAERGFMVGAVVDIFSAQFNRSPEALAASLAYLINDRSAHPAYLRYDGKPVILFAFQGRAGLSAAQWRQLRQQLDPARATLWIAEGTSGCCLYGGAMDGMYAFNMAWANGSSARYQRERRAVLSAGGSFYLPTIHPGWDETLIARREGRPNPTSPRARADGQFLATSFRGAAASGSDVILVGTWNEFIENSHIEPSVNYGTQSLDVLRPLIAEWKAGGAGSGASSAPLARPESPTGLILQATGRVNVRPTPSLEGAPVGVITPGVYHAVLEVAGDWYLIDVNGVRGYVNASVVRVEQR
jgi:hypothetical protein